MKYKHSVRYIICKINDAKTEVVIDKQDETFDGFNNDILPTNQNRFVVFDAECTPRNIIVLILWNPDESTVKQKMIYAAVMDKFKSILEGIRRTVYASDLSELTTDNLCGSLEHDRSVIV